MMHSGDEACTIAGIVGNIMSLILFLSPMPTFYHIWKKKSVEQYSPLPYLATLASCGLWVLYGLPMVHPHSTPVATINCIGFAIEIMYLSLFLVFSDPKKRLRLLGIVAMECILLMVLTILVLTFVKTIKLRSSIVGSICIAGSIMMYASPLSIMKIVINTRSVEYMSFPVSFFSFLSGVCWSFYALIQLDPFMAAPNGMGALLGLAQLTLYAIFYKPTVAQRKAQQEMGLERKPPLYNGHFGGINGA